jgi:hypothetical protein
MASFIDTIQTKIINLLDIPQFSNDLRLVILDYMHPRRVKKLEVNNKTHWLRLGPHLENNKLSLQIIIYDDSVTHRLSSFGLYCDQKAIHEFNNVSLTSPDKQTEIDLDKILFSGSMTHQTTQYHCRYVVCPISQSTIMFLIKHYVGWSGVELREYYIESDKYEWKSWHFEKDYSDFEHARTRLLFLYQLALTYGKDWYKHYYEPRTLCHPEIIEESFEGNTHSVRMIDREKLTLKIYEKHKVDYSRLYR